MNSNKVNKYLSLFLSLTSPRQADSFHEVSYIYRVKADAILFAKFQQTERKSSVKEFGFRFGAQSETTALIFCNQ